MIMATFKMNPQHYNIFLSHHKAAAATFVRFCKMLLVKNAGMIAYIDSDDLVDLADLYDVVGFRTKNLVVFLTGQTLTRAWCAGEITTANNHGVPLMLVKMDGWEELEAE